MEHKGLYLVRATLNLPGLRRGAHALVDPSDPYMEGALGSGALVRAESAPEDWVCVECGETDGRTALGGLTCLDCAPPHGDAMR